MKDHDTKSNMFKGLFLNKWIKKAYFHPAQWFSLALKNKSLGKKGEVERSYFSKPSGGI